MATILPLYRSIYGRLSPRRHGFLQQLKSGQLDISRRSFKTKKSGPDSTVADFAFAFDIDGVLLRSSKSIANAPKALRYLQAQRIPFILVTNGGGKTESERVADVSRQLGHVPLDTSRLVQSHTPFAELVHGNEQRAPLQKKCVLVTGGDGDKCRMVAESYGFENVITPGDIITADPAIWPFSKNFLAYYYKHACHLPRPLFEPNSRRSFTESLKVDAIFIFNDPRDWALDIQLIVDLLLSREGYLGTLSKLNNSPDLPNRGYQQDSQPPLYFSNPDLWWAAAYHLPRLGQGGFREALYGVWRSITGPGVELKTHMYGKPNQVMYAFAEEKLMEHRRHLRNLHWPEDTKKEMEGLKRVYMVGDNPESDVKGAKEYQSKYGTEWKSALVKTGVFTDTKGAPSYEPDVVVADVWEAVEWALENEKWKASDQVSEE